jgi:type I restriction enzyme M protein
MRRGLIESDLIECVIGLAPNLFYNSSMEAIVLMLRTRKPKERRGKILFIDAKSESAREQSQSFLRPEHQKRIHSAYGAFENEPGLAVVATLDMVAANDFSLAIPRYVTRIPRQGDTDAATDLKSAVSAWRDAAAVADSVVADALTLFHAEEAR